MQRQRRKEPPIAIGRSPLRKPVVWMAVLALALPAPGEPSWAQERDGRAWRVWETAHLQVIYPSGLEEVARRAAEIAEGAYAFWSEELGPLPPSTRIALVLRDRSDVRRAGRTWLPRETLTIDLPLGLPRYPWASPWDGEQLLFFEIGRLLNEARAEGIARELRGVVGKLASPGRLQPLWLREGLLYALGTDRWGKDPSLEMIVEEIARSGRFPTLAELSTPVDAGPWPSAPQRARALGGEFLRYLQQNYGQDLAKRLHRAYAVGDLRALLGDALPPLTGRTAEELYAEFRRWLQERAPQGFPEEPPGRVLPTPGGENYGLAWDPFGESLVYEHRGPRRGPQLRRVGRDGTPEEALVDCLCLSSAWVDERTLVYVKLTRTPDDRLLGDLYLYDQAQGRERRVTQGERIYAVAPFPDGRRLLLARNELGGRSSLVVFDLRRRSRRIVREFGPQERVHSLAVSPDGARLAISLWRFGRGTDLYLLPAEGGLPEALTPLTQDAARDLDPAFSADGRFLLFSSDRSGRFQIYAYEFATQKLFRVTQTSLGHFDPTPSPDGRLLAYVAYGPGGFRVRVAPYEPARWEPWRPPAAAPPELPEPPDQAGREIGGKREREREKEKKKAEPKPYDPAPALLPTFWVPLLGGGQGGFFTRGADPLGWHRYELTLGLGLAPFELFSDLSYTNARFSSPRIHLQVTLSPVRQRQRIALEFLLKQELTEERRLSISLSHEAGATEFLARTRWLDRRSADLFRRESELVLTGGVRWRAPASLEAPRLVRRLQADWLERLRLPVEDPQGVHEVLLRVQAGWIDPTGEPFRLGGLGGEHPMRSLLVPQEGRQLLQAQGEYRFPLRRLILTCCADHPLPILGEGLEGSLFAELGLAGEALDFARLRAGVGAELRMPFSLGFGLLRGEVRLGGALDLRELVPRFYLTLGPS